MRKMAAIMIGAAVWPLAMPNGAADRRAIVAADSVVMLSAVTSPASAPAQQYWIGVAVEAIPPSVSRLLALPDGQGLLVADVVDGSPAKAADIHVNDLLLTFDHVPLNSPGQLVAAMNPTDGSPPSVHEIVVLRELQRVTLHVTPAERPPALRITEQSGQRVLLPNGSYLNVGPGYKVDADASGPNAVVDSIEKITKNGQSIIVTQKMDETGQSFSTITVGTQVYSVTPQSVKTLPPDLQALGNALLHSTPAATEPDPDKAEKRARLKALQEEAHRLEQELQANAPAQ